MNHWKWIGTLCWVGWAGVALAQEAPPPAAGESPPAAGKSVPAAGKAMPAAGKAMPPDVIVVTGASGAPRFAEPFAEAAARWVQVAGEANARLQQIGPAAAEAETREADGTSDFARLRSALQRIEPQGDVPVWIVLIGHGTFAQQTAKFNLVGPDVAAAELARWVAPWQRPLVVINGASASGPFINRLTGPRRIIVTATRSGEEQNYARFGGFFAAAIGDLEADLDHDRTVSVLEAFLAAAAATEAFYAEQGRLATEHALLDDNGDGRGTSADFYRGVRIQKEAGEGSVDGETARRVALRPPAGLVALTAAQRAERDRLEAALLELRDAKPQRAPADYFADLHRVALELAELYRAAEETPAEETSEEPADGADDAAEETSEEPADGAGADDAGGNSAAATPEATAPEAGEQSAS